MAPVPSVVRNVAVAITRAWSCNDRRQCWTAHSKCTAQRKRAEVQDDTSDWKGFGKVWRTTLSGEYRERGTMTCRQTMPCEENRISFDARSERQRE
eukprot:3911246-Rhodomonas_salina.3